MAQQLNVVLLDDLDGTEADQTITFSLDGQRYEIDLSTENVNRLHEVLAPFTTNARTTNRTHARRSVNQPTPPTAAAAEPSAETTPATITEPAADATPAAADPGPTGADSDAGDSDARARPGVPAALFSNPTQHVATHVASAPKPPANGLFTTGG
jgi:hypothetical protein